MAQEGPDKPAPDDPKTGTTKKPSQKPKTKSAPAAKKTARTAKPRKTTSATTTAKATDKARKKKSGVKAASTTTRKTSAGEKASPAAPKTSETGAGAIAGGDQPIENERNRYRDYADNGIQENARLPQDAAAVGAKVTEAGPAEAKAGSAATPTPLKNTWTPVPPETHDVGDNNPSPEEEPDPMKKTLFYAGGVLALLVFLIFGASLQNLKKYYVVERDGAVEIWKGRFSPLGRQKVAALPDVVPPAEAKDVYTRQEVHPILFTHYINKADESMGAAGSPDFEGIKAILAQAEAYATSAEERAAIAARRNIIDRTLLIYKAEVAAEKGTIGDLTAASTHLRRAAALEPDAVTAEFIQQKITSIQEQLAALKAEPPQAEQPEQPTSETAPPTPTDDKHESPEESPSESQAPAEPKTT
jgi:hypothetical protein